MADPMDDDDDYNWDLCIAEIDKVERAAVEKKTAQQFNAPQSAAPRPSLYSNGGQASQQGHAFTPQRGTFPQPQQAPPQPNLQAHSHQNPQAFSHQQRPMLIQPVAPPRASFQQAPGARWQAPGVRPDAGVVHNTPPRQPLQPVQAQQQNGPPPQVPMQAKPNAPAVVSNGQSSHPVSAAGPVQQDLWRLQEELRQKADAIKDKDGCISLLRSRVQTAESETFELRKRAAGVTGSSQQASSRQTTDMQREIERLQAQLLFKDQEVQEAKRAKAEKDAKMKEAQEAAQRLEGELRAAQSQQRASPGSAAKRRRELDADSPTRPLALNQQLNRLTSEPGALPGRSPKALFKGPAHGRGGERPQQKQSQESERPVRTPAASSTAASSAGVTSSAAGVTSSAAAPSPAAGPTPSDAVAAGRAEERARRESGGPAVDGTGTKSREREPTSLLSVERLETVGARLRDAESGACFVQKLFAVAAGDVFALVSGGDGAERNGAATDGRKSTSSLMRALAEPPGEGLAMKVDVASEREAFRDAFVQVMNGHKPVATLFPPLRSALDSKKPTSVYASLRVLRVLVRLDSTSRSTVLGSAAATPLRANWGPIQPSTPTSQTTVHIGLEHHLPLSSIDFRARLSSRIKLGPASKAHAAAPSADVSSGRQTTGKGKAPVGSDRGTSGTTEDATRVASGFAPSGSGRSGAPIDRGFFDRLIELAVEAEDPRAQFEAASTLALLVAHVPSGRRTELAFLVTERKLEPLIGFDSPPPVRGVALHIAHLLCESPPLVEFLFSNNGANSSGVGKPSSDGPGKPSDGGGRVSEGTRASGAAGKRPETSPSTSGRDDSPGGVASLFSAVAACLGPETTDPLLKQAAVELLAFVHGLSDRCAGLLTSLGRNESDVRESTPQLGATDATGPDAEAKHVKADVDKAEPSIVARLLDVLDEDLRGEAEGTDGGSDERAALRGEACSLLASLVQHDEALGSIYISSRRTRLAISVVTRMIKLAETASDKASRNIIELAKSLQRRILDNMPPQTNEVVNA